MEILRSQSEFYFVFYRFYRHASLNADKSQFRIPSIKLQLKILYNEIKC